ncbi:hypothetical protein BGW38_010945 [Lunasporangiospora selenospora]|uniref:Cyclic nucleotide-binding domain-containing protein n=1 Tax=Lunasporangiospora selenospora TaxID=979761 RepID=A0A9P6G208_9FUNG|nr:hypothetical protein BGW38_010945 [Lunasporangiospora selenospora]
MLWPTDPSLPLRKAAVVDHDQDVPSTNSDPSVDFIPGSSRPTPNTFDNSRPSSPAPAPPPLPPPTLSTSTTGSSVVFATSPAATARHLTKIALGAHAAASSSSGLADVADVPTLSLPLRTPPQSPIKSIRRESFSHPICPPPPAPQRRQSFQAGAGPRPGLHLNLSFGNCSSSPPYSPTLNSPAATLPPRLSQSLAEHPLFRGCTEEGIHSLASRMHIRHYHPQDHIIHHSEQSSAMFYVLRGTVKVVSHDNEATFYEIKENNFFGDVGVLYRVPRSMDVLAKNRCTIAILSGEDLVKAMEQSPEMAKAIGYQTQERYQMYLKRRQSVSTRRTLDLNHDDAKADSFAKSDVHSAIQKVPLFQNCPSEVIHMLSLNVEPRTYNIGQTITKKGEIGREMFFIASGVVEVLSDDSLRVLARFHDGQFFGEIAVLLDVPRIAEVKAVSEVEVFVLTKENLEAVFKAVPGAAETITTTGHRLYQNWLMQSAVQAQEQQQQQLDVDQGASILGSQVLPDFEKSHKQDHEYSIYNDIAISVLPLTSTLENPMGQRPCATQFLGPMSNEELGSTPHPQLIPGQSYFDQDGDSHSSADNTSEPPMSRNKTIRGLQDSNPKRRRASVAVWSQQDLMKLAEAAQAKTHLDATHTPMASTTLSTLSQSPTSMFATAWKDDEKEEAAEPMSEEPTKRADLSHKNSADSLHRKALLAAAAAKKLVGPATFQDLEEPIVVRILSHLPVVSLLKARRVCKTWNRLIQEHDGILNMLDLSMHKKIVTDLVLLDLCRTVLSHNPRRTTVVSLRDCFLITDPGLTELARHLPNVQDLDLHSCWNVTDNGFRMLGLYCSQLRSIDFSNCRKMGDATIFALYPEQRPMELEQQQQQQQHHHHYHQLNGSAHAHANAVLGQQADLEKVIGTTGIEGADTSMDDAQALLTHSPSIGTPDVTNGHHIEELMEEEEEEEEDGDDEDDDEDDSTASQNGSKTTTKVPSPEPVVPRGCPLLSRLNLSYCKNLTDKSFVHLSIHGSKQLESLNLQRCTTITTEAFISLDLDHRLAAQVCLNEVDGIQDQTAIVEDESEGSLSSMTAKVEPCFPRLRELLLSDCTFLTDAAIVALAPNMPALEDISLSFCCALTDIAVEAVSEHCPQLKRMDLSFCGSAVSDASLYQIAQWDGLVEDVDENGSRRIRRGPSLEDLEIRGCVRVTESGVREVLNGCPKLKRLNISSCTGVGSRMMDSDDALPSGEAAADGEQQQQQGQETSGASGSLTALSNPSQHQNGGQLAKKMRALKRGKEWALAQQRPGLEIVVFYNTPMMGRSYVSSVFHWHFAFTLTGTQAGPSNMVEIDGHPYQFMAFRKLKGNKLVTIRLQRVEPLHEDQVEEVSLDVTLMTQLSSRILGNQKVCGVLTSRNLTITCDKIPSEPDILNFHVMISFSNRSIEKPVSRFEGLFPDTPTANVEIRSSKGVTWTTVHKDAFLDAIPNLLKHVKVQLEPVVSDSQSQSSTNESTEEPTLDFFGLDILKMIQEANIHDEVEDSSDEDEHQDVTNRSDTNRSETNRSDTSLWEEMYYDDALRSPDVIRPLPIPHSFKELSQPKAPLEKVKTGGPSKAVHSIHSSIQTVPEEEPPIVRYQETWVCPESWDRNAVSKLVYWAYTGQTTAVKDLEIASNYLTICKTLDLKNQYQEALHQAQLFIRGHAQPFKLASTYNFKADNGVAKTLKLELEKVIKSKWTTVIQDPNLQAALSLVDPSGVLLGILANGVPR